MAVWLVADFEALSYQVTTTFDTGCDVRIPTAPAINYTACCVAAHLSARHFAEYVMLRPFPYASISPFSFNSVSKRFTVGFGMASFVAMSLDFMPE